jgi:decaprenylphospho-beta-D-erythro-pentofuranosid-2-ulose 2-reductase
MKKILILGATSAIAENCARIWAEEGNSIFLVARNYNRLVTIATDLRVRGAARVDTFTLDLNDFDRHKEMLEMASISMDGLDIALIAHGTLSNQKECEQSVELTMQELRTNALSTISLLTLIANEFESRQSGTIAVISSVAGDRGRASNYVYGSAKAMVTAFTSGLRQRLYTSNVAVITIKPGFVDSPMTASIKKGILWTSPSNTAQSIVHAIRKKRTEIYYPHYWWAILKIVKIVPNNLFQRIRNL